VVHQAAQRRRREGPGSGAGCWRVHQVSRLSKCSTSTLSSLVV